MKKLFALILAGTLAAGSLSACGSTAVVAVPQPESTAAPESESTAEMTPSAQTGESAGEGAVKTGLSVTTSLTDSKPAADGEDGLAQANINLVAVTISDDGVIDECVIDAVQSKVNFDATGKITTDLTAPVSSKNELGDSYGMKKASSIGKEWNEQVQALADYVEGKTLDEIRGIAVTEDGKAGEADLAASVTISIAGYIDAIEEAAANATHLGAMAGDTLYLTSTTSLADSADASAEGDGLAQAYTTAAAITMNGDTITSCDIDAVQANVNFDTTGAITTDLTAPVATKVQLGDSYGMKKASSIGKEWYEQAAAFGAYVVGKTPEEVAGIAVTEDGKAGDADLAASVTISIGDFQTLVAKAGA